MPRVLVVEDSLENRQLVSWILEDAEYEISEAETAEEGLDLLQKEKIDAILMDISLPGMSGDEAIKIIRNELKLDALPIIALTAHALPEDHARFIACGATDIITKPVDEELLVKTLSETIHQSPQP